MTVKELIEELKRCDQFKVVYLELAQDYLLGSQVEEDDRGVWLSCGSEVEVN